MPLPRYIFFSIWNGTQPQRRNSTNFLITHQPLEGITLHAFYMIVNAIPDGYFCVINITFSCKHISKFKSTFMHSFCILMFYYWYAVFQSFEYKLLSRFTFHLAFQISIISNTFQTYQVLCLFCQFRCFNFCSNKQHV